VRRNFCQRPLIGLLSKQKQICNSLTEVGFKRPSKGETIISVREKMKIGNDERDGFSCMRTSDGVHGNFREGVAPSPHLTIFTAPTTGKKTETYPVKYGHETREMLCWCLANHVPSLGIKGAEHLMCVRFSLCLRRAPFESLCNGVSEWWKNLLCLGADDMYRDPQFPM